MTENDKKNIYIELVNLLVTYCDTCLDKHQKEKILLCAFKLELIEYAEKNDQDAEELWESIARTLGMKFNGTTYISNIKKCSCSNGSCSIC